MGRGSGPIGGGRERDWRLRIFFSFFVVLGPIGGGRERDWRLRIVFVFSVVFFFFFPNLGGAIVEC